MNEQKLWTRDFTIITLGSVISMVGSALSGFAISLLVLDYTESTLLYAIYIVLYTAPQLIMPIFSGALLDRFSRKRMIYTLDFISAGLYMVLAVIMFFGLFRFWILALGCFLMGGIFSVYQVAYDSFYPLLITEGNYSKAYSIASVLETLSMLIMPVSALVYNFVGITPLLMIDAVSFFIAACFETQIKAEEKYIDLQEEKLEEGQHKSVQLMFQDIKEGFFYLVGEKGLLAVAIYFTFSSLGMGASSVIDLPYFRSTYEYGEYLYLIVWGMAVVGRAIGGGIHYNKKLPKDKKYAIALTVYLVTNIIEGYYLFLPIPVMMVFCFISGILGVTSYTIRVSATQTYVPDEKKGRFNGAFNVLNTGGMLVGELVAGAACTVFSPRIVLAAFMTTGAVAALVTIGGNKKEVSRIYNTDN